MALYFGFGKTFLPRNSAKDSVICILSFRVANHSTAQHLLGNRKIYNACTQLVYSYYSILLIKPFVWWRCHFRCRRGLLKALHLQ